ncbi:filaggrin-like [Nycticebus coucang]|uniref:filaggrin-like n=1 Tax=Nycticebus coucang TaxID=9470 RepID=UPI00234C29E9|nr:filaggrin-like [Nycticebus coucang]
MSTVLENIISIIDIFHQYAEKDKETDTLSKKELKELLETQFRPVLKNPDDADVADVFVHILDINHNEKIDFTEFLVMIFKLAQAYYKWAKTQNFQTSPSKNKKYTQHTRHRQERRHEQSGDRSQHSGARHAQHPSTSGDRGQRGSTVSQVSDSEGQSEDADSHSEAAHEWSGQHQKNHGDSIHSQSEERSRHLGSLLYQISSHEQPESSHGQHRSDSRGTQGSRQEQGRDSSRHSVAHEGEASSHGQSTSSGGRRERAHQEQSGDRSEHTGSRHHVSDSANGQSVSRSASRQRSGQQHSRDSARRSGSRHEERSPQEGRSRHSVSGQGVVSETRTSRHQGSNVSHDDESERHSEDSERQAGSGSRNHHGSAQGQSRDSSRHSGSHQGHRASHWESNSALAHSGSSTRNRQERRHEQSGDRSQHSGARHAQHPPTATHQAQWGSSVSQASDREGQSEDADSHSEAAQQWSGQRQRNHGDSVHSQSEERSRHLGSLLYQIHSHEQPESSHGHHRSYSRGRQGSRQEQGRDSSRHSVAHEGEASSLRQSTSSRGRRERAHHEQSGDRSERTGSRHQVSDSAHGQSVTRSASRQRSGQQHSGDSASRSGSHHEERFPQEGRSRYSVSEQGVVSESGRSRHQGSNVSQDGESEGHSEDSERQAGSGSRNHHGSAQGHSRDSSRHSGSHQGHGASHGESDSALAHSGSRTRNRQDRQHEQLVDRSQNTGARHAQHPSTSNDRGQRGSSVRQASDREGQSEDEDSHSEAAQEWTGQRQRDHGDSVHSQSEESSRHSGSLLIRSHEQPESSNGQQRSDSRGRQGSRQEQGRDSSRHSVPHEGETSSHGQSTSRGARRERARHEQSGDRSERTGSRHHVSDSAHGQSASRSASRQRSGQQHPRDSANRSGSHHEERYPQEGRTRHSVSGQGVVSESETSRHQGSNDPVQDTDKRDDMSSRETGPRTLALRVHNIHLHPVTEGSGDPVSVRPVIAKDNQKMQTATQRRPRNGVGNVRGTMETLSTGSQRKDPDTWGLSCTRYALMNSLRPPMDSTGPTVEEDRDRSKSRVETALDTQWLMRVRQAVTGSPHQAEKEGKEPTRINQETGLNAQGPVTTCLILPMVSQHPEVLAGKDLASNIPETQLGDQGHVTRRDPLRKADRDTQCQGRE